MSSEEPVEKIDVRELVGAGASGWEIGIALLERCRERLAADVADLIGQGYTLDQIEIVRFPPEVIDNEHGGKTVRVHYRVVGRRPA